MSNKVLCTCGKEHACDQPLVITITTCPKNKHQPKISSMSSDNLNPDTSSSVIGVPATHSLLGDKRPPGSNDLDPEYILTCEDGGVTVPTKNAEKPLIDNSTFCDLDCEFLKRKDPGYRPNGSRRPSAEDVRGKRTLPPSETRKQEKERYLKPPPDTRIPRDIVRVDPRQERRSSTPPNLDESAGPVEQVSSKGSIKEAGSRDSLEIHEQKRAERTRRQPSGSRTDVRGTGLRNLYDLDKTRAEQAKKPSAPRTSIKIVDDPSTEYPRRPRRSAKPDGSALGVDSFRPDQRGRPRDLPPVKGPVLGEGAGRERSGPEKTFFDPSYELSPDEDDILDALLSDNGSTRPSAVKVVDAERSKSRSATLIPQRDAGRREVSYLPKDSAVRYPSGSRVKLPILMPRYHGPGCAMEVDVLERHDPSCRYRKGKDPNRSPIDDRSGSYDVIGRLMFKTCNAEFPERDQSKCCTHCPRKSTVSNIYSLFNMPYMINQKKQLRPSSGSSQEELEKYLRKKKLLEDLARNTKSFPNQSKYVEERRKVIQVEKEGDEVTTYRQNVTSYEVEVLYFYENKCNKSVQFTRPRSSPHAKKWFYYIFPCIAVEESETFLLNDY